MSRQYDIPESLAWPIIGRLESSQTQRSKADVVGVVRSDITRLFTGFQETGYVRRRQGQGRPRATTANNDQYILITARRDRRANSTQILRQLLLAIGRKVLRKTIQNRIHEDGLHAG